MKQYFLSNVESDVKDFETLVKRVRELGLTEFSAKDIKPTKSHRHSRNYFYYNHRIELASGGALMKFVNNGGLQVVRVEKYEIETDTRVEYRGGKKRKVIEFIEGKRNIYAVAMTVEEYRKSLYSIEMKRLENEKTTLEIHINHIQKELGLC